MASRQADDLVGRLVGGRFELEAPVGRGQSSLVFAATDTETGTRVAVKLLPSAFARDESFIRRFRHEVRAAASIDHPHINRVISWGDQRELFVVSEFATGGSLRALMSSGVRLSPEQAGTVAVDVARGLAHLHKRGIVHRVVRPSNILFGSDGHAQIADVGVGWILEQRRGDNATDYRYMAPEMSTDGEIDGEYDVYALAFSLIEAVTGRIPMLGDDLGSTMLIRSENELAIPAEWGPVRRQFLRASRTNPAQRASAGEFELGLISLGDQLRPSSPIQPVGAFGGGGTEPPIDSVEPTFFGVPGDRLATGSVPVISLSADAPTSELSEAALRTGTMPAVDANGRADGTKKSDSASTGGADDVPRLVRRRSASRPGESVEVPDSDSGDPQQSGRARAAKPTGSRSAEASVDAKTLTGSADVDGAEAATGGRSRRVLAIVGALVAIAAVALVVKLTFFGSSGEVPSLIGKDLQSAKIAADEHEWKLDSTELVREDDTKPDEIVRQDPAPGVALAQGKTLKVTVSLGPTLVPLPGITGLSVADATKALGDFDLRLGTQTKEASDDITKGGIIRSNAKPDSSGMVPKGTVVNVVVSTGPKPRVVPGGLIGKPSAAVSGAIEAVGLKASITGQPSEKVAKGMVISVDPKEGTALAPGATVKIVISEGPPLVTVPNVAGQAIAQASSAIVGAGLGEAGVQGPSTSPVLRTDPAAGTAVPKGTAVRLITE